MRGEQRERRKVKGQIRGGREGGKEEDVYRSNICNEEVGGGILGKR